jgi:hypothetical protein
MNSFKEHHPACEICGAQCSYEFTPTVTQVILKDGPSGSWPSKGNHFQTYRAKRSEEMTKRQKDRYGHLRRDAIPNYDGKDTGTWAEAQFQALKEKGADSAASYNDKVKVERSSGIKI